jgi:hypothetical protein
VYISINAVNGYRREEKKRAVNCSIRNSRVGFSIALIVLAPALFLLPRLLFCR